MKPKKALPMLSMRNGLLSAGKFVSEGYPSRRRFKQLCRQIIHDFDTLPITDEKKPRVGVVGEILVKFLPAANNYLVDLLEHEGAEAVVPDLADIFTVLLLQYEL